MTGQTEYQPRYKWRKTWPDRENDFVGYDPATPDHVGEPATIGRFHLQWIPGGEKWLWSMQWGSNGRELITTNGIADTPREAAKAIEESYDRLKAINSTPS